MNGDVRPTLNEYLNRSNQELADLYEILKNTKTDINEHLPTLKQLSSECEHVTEMGTRYGVSTVGFLAGEPKVLECYDISKQSTIPKIEKLIKKTIFIFHEKDTTAVDIKETDLLFIDTLHTYKQLKKELELHAEKAIKYIVLHDTETFGFVSESNKNEKGLKFAIDEFLNLNKNWEKFKHYKNNNGLTVLKRTN